MLLLTGMILEKEKASKMRSVSKGEAIEVRSMSQETNLIFQTSIICLPAQAAKKTFHNIVLSTGGIAKRQFPLAPL